MKQFTVEIHFKQGSPVTIETLETLDTLEQTTQELTEAFANSESEGYYAMGNTGFKTDNISHFVVREKSNNPLQELANQTHLNT